MTALVHNTRAHYRTNRQTYLMAPEILLTLDVTVSTDYFYSLTTYHVQKYNSHLLDVSHQNFYFLSLYGNTCFQTFHSFAEKFKQKNQGHFKDFKDLNYFSRTKVVRIKYKLYHTTP